MKKLVSKFKDQSIFFRLMVINIFVFIIILAVSIFNYSVFVNEKETTTINSINQNNELIVKEIDEYIRDIESLTKIPINYTEYGQDYVNYLKRFDQTGKQTVEFNNVNERIFSEIMSYKSSVSSCIIYNTKGQSDYRADYPVYGFENPRDEQWFQSSLDAFGKSIFIDTYKISTLVSGEERYVFGVSRGMLHISDAKVYGNLVVNTDISYFEEMFNTFTIYEGHKIILEKDGKILYDSDYDKIGTSTPLEFVNLDNKVKFNEIDILGKTNIITTELSSETGINLISLLPKDIIFDELNKFQINILLATAVALIFSSLGLFLISRQIVKPIRQLISFSKLVEKGSYDIQIKAMSKDEIGQLASSFNVMISEINDLINKVYVEKLNQTNTELQMLQAQINPHFLYNTIESISMMAIINDDEVTSDMAQNLGAILRYSISDYNSLVMLGEEVEHLENYISLQEMRFKEHFTIKIDIPPDLYRLKIIKMILQPVVENAIYHGMNGISSGGEILISGRLSPELKLELTVKDNGLGIENVELLNDYINDKNKAYNSIGMKNVNKRIKLKYGENSGVEIFSKKDEGTLVIISLDVSI